MFSCRFNLFCVLCILCINLCIASSHIKKCLGTDRQALLKLKDGFTDKAGILSSWNGEECCEWEGIECHDLTGQVIHLFIYGLISSRLGGMIDSSICELQHLTELCLSNHYLEGKIPNCIGSLGRLIDLDFDSNNLVGVVPPTLGNLSNLQTLILGSNIYLVANNLEWLSHLSNLRQLDLSNMNLSRVVDWQSSISKLHSLLELRLGGCGLHQINHELIPHQNSSTPSWVLNVSRVLEHVDLSDNSLHSIPDVFANTSSLQYLDLSYNEIEGSIPKSFQSLCQLQELRLRSNKLSGQLHDNMRQLCGPQHSLEILHLNDNPFSSGPLPDFSWLSSLKTLSLRNTNIVGPLLEVSKLASLEFLDLSHNQLNGTLPYSIGQFSNLDKLYLSSNKLNGVISEAHLSNLYGLGILDVAENSLSFNLSSNWVPPFQLYALYASSCTLGPSFPTWLKHQTMLSDLQISNSGIQGLIPNWFWDLSSNLSYLNVSHNKLSGSLPKSLEGMEPKYLVHKWDFSFNILSGPLPLFPQLHSLFLSNNLFSGSLFSLCATSPLYLTYLDLSNNFLVGPLPDCWERFQSLEVLDLSKNNLSGRIPKSFGTLRQIESIHLNNNNFSDEISSLILCSNLKFIDFGDNNLQGTLPTWIDHHLPKLIVLRLWANKLHGNIPASLCNILSLQVLDLSQNNITGEIPQCLDHITALSNVMFPRQPISYGAYADYDTFEEVGLVIDKAILEWKGENREYGGKILGLLTIIDLSSNHLTGEIPQCITKLVALASLNLSGNNLTGFIPKTIGLMEMLESPDLSRNHLCGRMPASFSNLTFLSYMNLSFNNLTGKIPLGTQLQSFNASTYEGNNGLCGPPLTNHCPGNAIAPSKSLDKHVTDEDEDRFITFGFYISLLLGCFVGFWAICGTLVIKTSWRHAYFQFFNNVNDWLYVTIVVFTAKMKRRFQVQD